MTAVWSAFTWWFVSSLLGWVALPLTRRVFGRLADGGYGFSRPLGLLFVSYVVWLAGLAGWLANRPAGVFGAVIVLAAVGLWAGRGRWAETRRWLKDHLSTVLMMEALYLLGFAVWAFVRANNPPALYTEKPMEMAFLDSILKSPSFPPHDPWLSGFAISYYYFGYVMLAVLTQLTSVGSGVAFNLGNALWFGLTALGSYALLYDLVNRRAGPRRIWAPLLGPLLILITGNLEGFLDVLHAQHLFWQTGPNGQLTSSFWSWLGITDLNQPPTAAAAWLPSRNWWWWRASRVVHDVNLAGASVEVIDEFPFFSFLLADNHPHVLALPFVFTAVAYALQVFQSGRRTAFRLSGWTDRWDIERWMVPLGVIVVVLVAFVRAVSLARGGAGLVAVVAGAVLAGALSAAGFALVTIFTYAVTGRLETLLTSGEFWFAAWLFGSLAFLNTWDFPIYLSLLMLVLLWAGRKMAWRELVGRWATTGVALVVGGVLFYLPWYPSFSSQAGGILPNLAYPTRVQQFYVMFATSFTPIVVWLLWRWRKAHPNASLIRLVVVGVGVPLALLLLSWALAGAIFSLRGVFGITTGEILGAMGASDLQQAILSTLYIRLTQPFTALVLGFTLAICLLLLRPKSFSRTGEAPEAFGESDDPRPFIVLLIVIGALLVIGPEFLYLKDLFGTRMNTVFKFYYGAWLLWGIAGAYALTEVWPRRWHGAAVLRSLVVLPLILGLVYPLAATWTKTDGFDPPGGRTLDSTAYVAQDQPDEAAAIAWIKANLTGGVIAEAVGQSYTQYARVSELTGLPTVIGWLGHEDQWRGTAQYRSRADDVATLYTSHNRADIQRVLDAYNIAYVYVGPLERSTYQIRSLTTLQSFLVTLYQNNSVTIFGVPGRVER